jgi:hypothetical protein
MTSLYNCRHDGDQYRITKFDADVNVVSSYLCTTSECECPAGVRPTCRHREMLPKFIHREHIGDGWMLDHDRDGWVNMGMEATGTGTGRAEHQQNPAAGTAAGTAELHDMLTDSLAELRPFSRRGL